MNRFRSTSGQATVLTVIFLAALLGMVALVLDVGSWFREQRDTQGAADAAALAAAQALPDDPTTASAHASSYVTKNRGGTTDVTFSSKFATNDTVTVRVEREAPGVFAKLFGVSSVEVGAKATARATGLQEARWVAPIVVNIKHPDLNCDEMNGKPVPCFGKQTTLNLLDLHSPGSGDAAGSFGLINLDRSTSGNPGAGTLADWVTSGFDQYMGVGNYDAAPSANFNNSQFQSALDARIGDVLLFPIYQKIIGGGSVAKYDIVGWVGFRVESSSVHGSKSTLTGSFESVVWEGVQSQTGANLNFGVRAISLVE